MRLFTLFIGTFLLSLAGCGGESRGLAANGPHVPDPAHGQQLFQQTCSTCHGGMAQGLPHSGANLRKSKFVAQRDDMSLLVFVKHGRTPKDPENRSGVYMPPRGGNNQLDDPGILDIIAHLRRVQAQAKLDPPDDQDESAPAEDASAAQ